MTSNEERKRSSRIGQTRDRPSTTGHESYTRNSRFETQANNTSERTTNFRQSTTRESRIRTSQNVTKSSENRESRAESSARHSKARSSTSPAEQRKSTNQSSPPKKKRNLFKKTGQKILNQVRVANIFKDPNAKITENITQVRDALHRASVNLSSSSQAGFLIVSKMIRATKIINPDRRTAP